MRKHSKIHELDVLCWCTRKGTSAPRLDAVLSARVNVPITAGTAAVPSCAAMWCLHLCVQQNSDKYRKVCCTARGHTQTMQRVQTSEHAGMRGDEPVACASRPVCFEKGWRKEGREQFANHPGGFHLKPVNSHTISLINNAKSRKWLGLF